MSFYVDALLAVEPDGTPESRSKVMDYLGRVLDGFTGDPFGIPDDFYRVMPDLLAHILLVMRNGEDYEVAYIANRRLRDTAFAWMRRKGAVLCPSRRWPSRRDDRPPFRYLLHTVRPSMPHYPTYLALDEYAAPIAVFGSYHWVRDRWPTLNDYEGVGYYIEDQEHVCVEFQDQVRVEANLGQSPLH